MELGRPPKLTTAFEYFFDLDLGATVFRGRLHAFEREFQIQEEYGPKMAQNGPKTAPKMAQDGPKTAPRWPSTARRKCHE